MEQAMKYQFGLLNTISLKAYLGFTLPELMVTLAVVVILVTMTAPSMRGLITNQRVASATQEIFSAIVLARSEAIKRQRTVSVCSTVDGVSCDMNNTGWEQGWLIFTDADADGVLDNGDQVLRAREAQSEQIIISWNRGNSISFNSHGQTGTAGSFEICADGEAKAIVISLTGRSRVEDRELCS